MLSRQLAALSLAFAAGLAGMTLVRAADDDDSPTAKLMEKVQNNTNALRKATRNAAEYKKSVAAIGKATEEIAKLGKEAREIKEPAEKEKKPIADYQKLMDEMVTSSDDMGKLVAKPSTTQAQAKEAFTALTKTCSNCHNVFKKED